MSDISITLLTVMGVSGVCYLFLTNMYKRDKKNSDAFFEKIKTPEGTEKAKEVIKAFDDLRQINRNIKAGRPTLAGFEDTKPGKSDLDARIDEVLRKRQ